MDTKESTIHRICSGDVAGDSDLADESVALVVTSPPYPMISMWDHQFSERNPAVRLAIRRGAWGEAFEEMHRDLDRVWGIMHRALIPGGILCVNIGDATRSTDGEFQLFSNHTRIVRSCLSLGFRNLPNVIWRKPTNAPTKFMGSGMLPGGAYVTLEHEHILLFRKGSRRKFAGPEERRRRRESAFFWEERNQWFSDVWEIRGTGQSLDAAAGRSRSAAFPFEIAFRLIQMFSSVGEVVLDPFVGTGTTLLAAAASRRSGLGFEIDPAMAAVVRKRFGGNVVEALNGRLSGRIGDHLRYLDSHPGSAFRHMNRPHGFRVKTSHETDIRILPVEYVHRTTPDSFEVGYGSNPIIPLLPPRFGRDRAGRD